MLRPPVTLRVLSCSPLQFGRLERVEVGGTKGKALTNAIKQVHADFLAAHGKFQEVRCVAMHCWQQKQTLFVPVCSLVGDRWWLSVLLCVRVPCVHAGGLRCDGR